MERRLSIVEEIEAVVTASLKRAERLRQAILKRAFEGMLVPQDPNDEPASVLLERIRAERESVAANGKQPQRQRGRSTETAATVPTEGERAGEANQTVRQRVLDL